MKRRITMIAAAAAMVVGLSGGSVQAAQDCSNWSGGALLGTLGGAALGGLVGSQFGSGTGQLAFTGAGVLVGGLVGNQVGKALTCQDQQQVVHTTQQSLETQKSGTTVAWNNPDSGNSGTVTPVRTYQASSGQYCREFEQTVTVSGKTEKGYGTACRKEDGSWEIQS